MRQREDVTIQLLTDNEDILIGYSDDDIVVVDSIQKFTEVKTAHVSMNSIIICTSGKIQASMNGEMMQLHQNQVAIIPQNLTFTDVMVSPDFNLKGMFLTNRILQSFLREKMNVWNDMMYVHRLHLVDMSEDDMVFYTHFYDMLFLSLEKGKDNPFRTDVIQSLLRSAVLGLCGAMKQIVASTATPTELNALNNHFQRFLELLHSKEMKRHTVESYATHLCISPKYLSYICKKYSGKTASEWITERVMEDIRYYLKSTDYPIKEICARLGFANPSFFGKYVKEHFGLTPVQLRKGLH